MRKADLAGGSPICKAGHFRDRLRAAFTLLELLVASAVLALLLVLLLQVASHTMQASRITTQQLDATQAARRVIDTLAVDLSSSVSEGAAVLYQPKGASVSLAFLTSARGPATAAQPPRFLAVSYQLTDSKMMRLYQGVDWSTKDLLAAAESAAASGTPTVLSPGILQFAVLALLEDGKTVVNLQNNTATPPLAEPPVWRASGTQLFLGQTVPTSWSALVSSNFPASPRSPRVQALLVAVAAIDEQSLVLLSNSDRGLFGSPTTSDPVKEWEGVLTGSSLPGPARSAIRFHSKVIPLP